MRAIGKVEFRTTHGLHGVDVSMKTVMSSAGRIHGWLQQRREGAFHLDYVGGDTVYHRYWFSDQRTAFEFKLTFG